MAVAPKLWTLEDLEAMEPDDNRYELDRGELVTVPPPGGVHWVVVGNVFTALRRAAADRGLGIVSNNGGFVLGRHPDVVRMPDVAFIRAERAPVGGWPEGLIEGVPDLVVEVVSPPDRANDVFAKVQEYRAAGVAAVVLVWLRRRSVSVWVRDGGLREFGERDRIDLGEVLPGFTLPVADLFR